MALEKSKEDSLPSFAEVENYVLCTQTLLMAGFAERFFLFFKGEILFGYEMMQKQDIILKEIVYYFHKKEEYRVFSKTEQRHFLSTEKCLSRQRRFSKADQVH